MKNPDKIKGYYKKRLEACAEDDFYYQVGKTQYGKKVSAAQIDLITSSIETNLQLTNDDRVLDIGCANGLISYSIGEKVYTLTGIDLSDELIRIAEKHHARPNISYITDDIFSFNLNGSRFNKIYMYEVLQHFPYRKFRKLLQLLKSDLKSFRLFIGGIPDAGRLLHFYNDDEKQKFYFKSLERNETHLGTWWYPEHLKIVCDELDLNIKRVEQDPELYTAHYRFDCVVWTKNDEN